MPSERLPERRKSYCPTCKTTRGTPRGVTHREGERQIDYKCLLCGGQWSVKEPNHQEKRRIG